MVTESPSLRRQLIQRGRALSAIVAAGEQPGDVLFKADRRSRVWQVQSAAGQVVIKRFEYCPLRQAVAAGLGMHPAQREVRANGRLAALGIAVAPIVAMGRQRVGMGRKYWLATPVKGQSLQRRLRAGAGQLGDRQRMAAAVGRLAGELMQAGIDFKDLKTSNIVLEEAGEAWLIDTGCARGGGTAGGQLRMLAMLDQTAQQDGASRCDRLRTLRAMFPGDSRAWRGLARQVSAWRAVR